MNNDYKTVLSILKYNTDQNIIKVLRETNVNWINVLGYLTYHRVAGLAYEKVNSVNIRLFDYPVFFTTYLINQAQKIRTIEQHKWISMITREFKNKNIKHVFLKGAVLSSTLYSYGSRASNDIDLLINKSDIEEVTKILNNLGFAQGKYDYKNNRIDEFTDEEKKEIINLRGETPSFIMISTNPTIKTIDVDVNFSLNWDPNFDEKTVNDFLDKRILIENKTTGEEIYSLCYEHNFIELCIHLYKDSSLIDIIKKRKVLDLYKFVDIYYFIMKYFHEIDINNLYLEISKYKLDDYIFFSLMYVINIFPDANIDEVNFLINKLNPKENILNCIFDQYDENITMTTNKDILERIFSYDLIKCYTEEEK